MIRMKSRTTRVREMIHLVFVCVVIHEAGKASIPAIRAVLRVNAALRRGIKQKERESLCGGI